MVARGAFDLHFFAEVFFPHYCTHPFNAFHYSYFEDYSLGERAIRRVRAAPRGSAKSTLITLVNPLHDVCYGLENFIVFISNTAPLSEQKVKDIRDEIINNRMLVDTFGLRFSRKASGQTQFILENGDGHRVLFMPFGKGASVRGVRFGPHRPSKIICDDVEKSEEVLNERIRDKDARWLYGDVTKAGNENTNVEFVGTTLHRDSLLEKLLVNPKYEGRKFRSVISWSEHEELWDQWRTIYMNIDNDNRQLEALAFFELHKEQMLKGTEVMWPEKEPYYYLMEEMLEIGRRMFFQEKQNEALGSEDKVFTEFHWYKEEPGGIRIESNGMLIPWDELRGSGIAAIDPATGQEKPKKGQLGDYTCIPIAYQDRRGRIFVHHDYTKRTPPTKYIGEVFELYERFGFHRIGVETNLYRDLLTDNLKAEMVKRNNQRKAGDIRLKFYEITQSENKHGRIFRLEPKVTHGWILFNRALSQEFKNMLFDYPHADHDDGPDALEMLWEMSHHRYSAGGVNVSATR